MQFGLVALIGSLGLFGACPSCYFVTGVGLFGSLFLGVSRFFERQCICSTVWRAGYTRVTRGLHAGHPRVTRGISRNPAFSGFWPLCAFSARSGHRAGCLRVSRVSAWYFRVFRAAPRVLRGSDALFSANLPSGSFWIFR